MWISFIDQVLLFTALFLRERYRHKDLHVLSRLSFGWWYAGQSVALLFFFTIDPMSVSFTDKVTSVNSMGILSRTEVALPNGTAACWSCHLLAVATETKTQADHLTPPPPPQKNLAYSIPLYPWHFQASCNKWAWCKLYNSDKLLSRCSQSREILLRLHLMNFSAPSIASLAPVHVTITTICSLATVGIQQFVAL